MRAHIMGVSVREMSSDSRMATARVTANSRNSRPTTSPMNSRGISTAISDKVSDTRVKPICLDPRSAAVMAFSPASMRRAMFSTMTMASSTTNPVAMVRAIRVRLLMLKPSNAIRPNVPTRDSGTTTPGIRVARQVRKNTKVTATTRMMASSISTCTWATESRIVRVRSEATCSSTPVGSIARKPGSRAWTRSTTSMTLAPGWRWMFNRMAGVRPNQAAWSRFSAARRTCATSPRRSGAPFS